MRETHSMNTPQQLVKLITVLALGGILAQELSAQQPIVVPRDSTEVVVGGKRISVSYGRPAMHGRKIVGDYVPYNRVWRTGAGQATLLTTEADLELGGMEIPRGAYSLYTFPTATQWKLIVNKQTGQWGTIYNPQQDLARVALEKRILQTPVQRLTFAFERNGNGSGTIKIEWENTSLSLPFKVSPTPIVASPRDSVKAVFAGKTVSVNYGRPSARGRKIVGGVVPYNQIWRTGANEATTLSTEVDLVLGGKTIPRGTYSLYTVPSKTTWQLVINKEVGQSGLVYHQHLDLARVKLQKVGLKDYVERFTISVEGSNQNTGTLKLMWERTMLSIPFTLKTN
jgi:hypothetical protein